MSASRSGFHKVVGAISAGLKLVLKGNREHDVACSLNASLPHRTVPPRGESVFHQSVLCEPRPEQLALAFAWCRVTLFNHLPPSCSRFIPFYKQFTLKTSPLRLLVSVRNVAEARLAADAGVHVVDIKEPSRGSLGKADTPTIQKIVTDLKADFPSIAVSAAWGELKDLTTAAEEIVPHLNYIKLGLAGMRLETLWRERWQTARQQLLSNCTDPCRPPGWIAVVYVDALSADAPPINDIVAAAIDTKCAGVLFDTYQKAGGRLTDFISLKQLEQQVKELHAHGLMGIAAGKVQLQDLKELGRTGCDLVAVRTAACLGNDRHAGLDPVAMQRLLEECRR